MRENYQLENKLIMAKDDIKIRNEMIKDYKPFIIKTLTESQNKLIGNYYDDLLSVGMSAFEEAILKYDGKKGNFIAFSKNIIKLRSIDFYRKVEKLTSRELLVKDDFSIKDKNVYHDYMKAQDTQDNIVEIEVFKKTLETWHISLSDLVKHSPKSETIREQYKNLAKIIVSSEIVYHEFIDLKRLPIKYLLKNTSMNRRKVERGRLYIIAMVIILKGEFKTLKSYIN